jgi:hypothetical protein
MRDRAPLTRWLLADYARLCGLTEPAHHPQPSGEHRVGDGSRGELWAILWMAGRTPSAPQHGIVRAEYSGPIRIGDGRGASPWVRRALQRVRRPTSSGTTTFWRDVG